MGQRRLTWLRARRARVLAAFGMALVLAPSARADIDPSGAWAIQLPITDPIPAVLPFTVNFQRSGTTLTAYREFSDLFGVRATVALTGTIDPVSGAFSVSGPACPPTVGPGSSTIAGTFGPSGDSLTATLSAGFLTGAPIGCFHVAGAATGMRTSATCGDATVDGVEECDAGPQGGPRCTVGCGGAPANGYCTPADALCVLFSGAVCGQCAIGRCDGAGSCVQVPRAAGSPCRREADECDLPESCDGVSADCPADQAVPPPDTDADGLNDGCDPCTAGAVVDAPRLSVKRVLSLDVPDSISLRGTLTVADPAAIDPVQTGLRLLIEDAAGTRHTDVTAPPGSSWVAAGSGWTFRGDGPVRSIKLRWSASSPGTLAIRLRLRSAFSGALAETDLPVRATVVLAPPFASGQCGEAAFPGPRDVAPACELRRKGGSLVCR